MRASLLMACLAATAAALELGPGVIALPHDAKIAPNPDQMHCTTTIAGKLATEDGSAMVSYTNDCKQCDFRIVRVPGGTHAKGSMREVIDDILYYPRYVGSKRGEVYKPLPGQNLTIPRSQVPEANTTYSYYDGTYGIMNEKGLGMGESTCNSKIIVGANSSAVMCIAEMSRIALERCDNARCAIRLMGDLAVKYGFWDPEGAGGETLTIIDNKQEAWVFHVSCTKDGKSAVWVARRVPDDHICAIGNYFTIGKIDFNDTDNYMASPDIINVTIEHGYYDPAKGAPFHFAKAWAPVNTVPELTARRVWRVFNLVAPSLTLDPYASDWELPWSVKPDVPIPVRRYMAINRDHFEGSIFDLTQGIAAGPWHTPMRAEFTPPKGYRRFERPISLHRTSYSLVLQTRADMPPEVSGLTWFAPDAPHASVYVPFYAGATEVPAAFHTGWLGEFSYDSAHWAFQFLANYIDMKFSRMFPFIQEKQEEFETAAIEKDKEVVSTFKRMLEDKKNRTEALSYITNYSRSTGEKIVKAWWDLGRHLIVKFNDGFDNLPNLGGQVPYPTEYLDTVNCVTNHNCTWANGSWVERNWWVSLIVGIVVGAIITAIIFVVANRQKKREGYEPIADQ